MPNNMLLILPYVFSFLSKKNDFQSVLYVFIMLSLEKV